MDSRTTYAGMGSLLPFPDRQHRAWVIRPVGDGNFKARIEGDRDPLDDGPNVSEPGPLNLVRGALREVCNRRGLPIKIVGVSS